MTAKEAMAHPYFDPVRADVETEMEEKRKHVLEESGIEG